MVRPPCRAGRGQAGGGWSTLDAMTTTPVDPRPAAALIPLRDGADGLELFMIERHHALRFAPGAMVFPGGLLEAADHAPHWRGLWPGGEPPDDLPRRVAAVRETFEECGLLLTDGPLDLERHAALRAAVAAGTPFAQALAGTGLTPALHRAAPLARWVTPDTLPRRFDTLFFLALAPPDQEPVVDGGEAVAGLWGTPRGILGEAEAGNLRLVFATRMILLRLASCPSVDAALAEVGRADLRPIQPRLVETDAGPVFRILTGCGFVPTDTPAEKVLLG